ncbi:TolC family protein [Burkholderia gladioli]|uniref:TolC family protein n=1 Tax=Burkholderia gladioli TaxID=28095 RepID=UPI0024461E60|nr:TolC family protein [Burkholderia gladioli]
MKVFVHMIGIGLAVVGSAICRAQALDIDLFQTRAAVSTTPAAPLIGDNACGALPETRRLELEDAVLQALCANPQTRQAWAEARAQAAALGVADAAYLPQVNVTLGAEHDTLSTTYDIGGTTGNFRQSQNSSSTYGMLSLSWVLFDFGKRDAARRQAKALLAAANASQSSNLESVFLNTAQAFYALSDAVALQDAARRTEAIAKTSLAAASAKHAAGAGTLGDELQARISYRSAVLDSTSADGEVRAATGALAVAMGLDANTHLRIAVPDSSVPPATPQTLAGIDELIEEAKRYQPRLIAARAKVEAALAGVDAARAQARPTISLVGDLSQNNPSFQQQPQGLFSPQLKSSRGSSIGVQVTIPLFDGFAAGYRVSQASELVNAQIDELHDAELQASLDVWTSYQAVETDAANLDNTRDLLSDAMHALDVAQGRYKEGVGSFSELIDAQTALSDARKQRVLAISKWRSDRLKLSASLGQLSL